MTSDEMLEQEHARRALGAAEQASRSASQAGRRWARRYLLGIGAVSAGSLIVAWLLSPWVSEAWWGFWYAGLFAIFGVWLRRQPVQAIPRRLLFAVIGAWAVTFGVTMAFVTDSPLAYPIGAVAGFAVWAAGAWWAGR